MFDFITNYFNTPKNKNKIKHEIFSKQYRVSYNKLWIEQIRDYYP